MEGQTNFASSSSENGVLDVKPLRSLAPMFPAAFGLNPVSVPGPRPFVQVSSYVPLFPSGSEPAFSPFANSTPPMAPNLRPTDPIPRPANNGASHVMESSNFSTVTPNSAPYETPKRSRADPLPTHVKEASNFNTPLHPASTSMTIPLDVEDSARPSRGRNSASRRMVKRPVHFSSYSTGDTDTEGSDGKKVEATRKQRPRKGNNRKLALASSSQEDPRESVEVALMTFDALRRRILQLDEISNVSQRPDMKASSIMLDKGLRANVDKRTGPVPGIEVGDIFYFRTELCLVGLHAPPMGGIDTMSVKFDDEYDRIAINIVSAGGYENEEDNPDVLIYSGQGGGSGDKNDKKQSGDQKLERGNLALERSRHRGNLIRVIRSVKDSNVSNGRIYIYDGLYTVQSWWVDKSKSGFKVFKYKLVREPGQLPGFEVWKTTKKWIDNPSCRGEFILSDISSGIENIPVCLVNEVDDEKGPSHFEYVTKVKYQIPISLMQSMQSCSCLEVCLPGSTECSCACLNGGNLPYSATGFLVSRKNLINECNDSCQCSTNCRNRVSQKGVKLHFEVFKTRDRGWGLRSWDPIRTGSFICEYTGEVVNKIKIDSDGEEEDEFRFQATCVGEKALKWSYGPDLLSEESQIDTSEPLRAVPITISAKNMGNVSRFMNHSCSPNAFWQPIMHDHGDAEYPHIMFFALTHIPPMTELTYDYGFRGGESGYVSGPRSAKKCLCGSSKCRGYFG